MIIMLGTNALAEACSAGIQKKEVIEMLVDYGADKNLPGLLGSRPCFFCCMYCEYCFDKCDFMKDIDACKPIDLKPIGYYGRWREKWNKFTTSKG